MNQPEQLPDSQEIAEPLFTMLLGLAAGVVATIFFFVFQKRRNRPASTAYQTLPAGRPVEPLNPGAPGYFQPSPGARRAEKKPETGRSAPTSMRWSTTTKYLVGVGLFLFLIILIYMSRSILDVLIMGALLAFILQPPAAFFQRRLRMRRSPAVFLAHGIGLLLILLLPLIIVPSIVKFAEMVMAIEFSLALEGLVRWLENLQATVVTLPFIGSLINSLLTPLLTSLQRFSSGVEPDALSLPVAYDALIERLATMAGTLFKAVGAIGSAVVAVLLMVIISIYISIDGHQIRGVGTRLLPSGYQEELETLGARLSQIWQSFLRGQLILMVLIGVVVWLGAVILGLPEPVFFGFLSGVLELIPSIGPLLAFIPAVLTALVFGSTYLPIDNLIFALIVAIFYLLVQALENQFIVPKVLGDAVNLHPLVVMLGALVAGIQWGILGVFLAAPLIATGREIFLYLYDKIREPAQALPPPTPPPSFLETIRNAGLRLTQSISRRLEPPQQPGKSR